MLALFLKTVGLLLGTVRRTPKSMIPSFSAVHILGLVWFMQEDDGEFVFCFVIKGVR